MELRLFNFEIKNLYTEYWQLVSEVTALGMLEKNFERITPKITEMLHGTRADAGLGKGLE